MQANLTPLLQTELPWRALPVAQASPGALDAIGWQIGADHARWGRPLPLAHLHPGSPLGQGWLASRQRRLGEANPARVQWLALRLQAWLEGLAYDETLLTPHHLQQLRVQHCPVTRLALQDEIGHPQQPAWVTLDRAAGYRAGRVVMLSQQARLALGTRSLAALRALAAQSHALGAPIEGLDAAAWARLAALLAWVTPSDACPLPLPLLPPNRLHIHAPLRALQAWIGRQLGEAGWSRRLLQLHDALPGVAARQAVTGLSAALAPHALMLPAADTERRARLDDLWSEARVQRRWLQLAESLASDDLEHLLLNLPAPAGCHVQRHAPHDQLWAA